MSGNIIFSYTWDDAVKDGTFINVSGIAKKWGFTLPVAITSNLFSTHVKRLDSHGCEMDLATDRMITLLLVQLKSAIRNKPDADGLLPFQFCYDDKKIDVWATIEGRNPKNPEPVMTIMLPEDY